MIRELTKKWLQGWVELVLAFPILLYIILSVVPDAPPALLLGLLPLHYLAGILLGRLLAIRHRGLQIAIGIAVGGTAAFLLFGVGAALAVGGILYAAATVRGFLFNEAPWPVWFKSIYFLPALLAYFIAYFIFRNNAALQAYLPAVTWCGLIGIASTWFVINERNLNVQSLSDNRRRALAPSVIRQNRMMIAVTVVLIALLGNLSLFGQLADGISAAFRGLVAFILRLFDKEYGNVEEPLPQISGPRDGEFTEREPSALGPLLERYASYVVAALLVAGLLVLVFLLIKNSKKWLERLRQLRFKYRSGEAKAREELGFVDEKSTIMDWKALRQSYSDRLKGWLARLMENEPRWEQLQNNTERVRFIYRNYLLRRMVAGYRFKNSLTPAETAEDLRKWDPSRSEAGQLIDLYNQARYGNGRLDEADVNRLYEKVNSSG